MRISVGENQRLPPERTVQLSRLTFLLLANSPEVVGYILAHMDIPAVAALEIYAKISDGDAAQALGLLLDDRLPKRLFSDPPVFEIGNRIARAETHDMGCNIGGFEIKFQSSRHSNLSQNAFVVCIPLVPSFVTTLQADSSEFDQEVWRELFRSHPEVRSIGCYGTGTQYRSLWDALSPVRGQNPIVSCSNLESIHFEAAAENSKAQLMPLLTCLRDRKTAGFMLRRLNIDDDGKPGEAHLMAEDFRPLVEVLEVTFPPIEIQRVSSILTHGADIC